MPVNCRFDVLFYFGYNLIQSNTFMEDNMKLVNVLEKDIDYPDLIQLIENGDENTKRSI